MVVQVGPGDGLSEALTARLSEQTKVWRDELVNTTRTNRLLYYRPTKASTLEFGSVQPQVLLNRLLGDGELRFFMPEVDEQGATVNQPMAAEAVATNKTSGEILAALRNLDRRSRQEFIDRGVWTLYLALGALRWIDPQDEKPVSSPLLLVPVSLERSGPSGSYVMRRNEGDTALNPALAIKLDAEFGLRLPTIDEIDEAHLKSVIEAVAGAVAPEGRWSAIDTAVLSTFTFAKEAMYQDLLANDAAVGAHPIVQALALGPDAPEGEAFGFEPLAEDELDTKVTPESSLAVLDADGTQRRCIAAALAGRSFVMDGPPGSGKSQTITNMIGELIAAGKSVLFVSEKAAALEVVHNRLQVAKLEPFVLELHSFKATRKAVATKLGQALAEHPRATGALGRDEVAALQGHRNALTAYAQALNEVREPLGRSLTWVLGRLAQLDGLPPVPLPAGFGTRLSAAQVADLLAWADRLSRAWGPVERDTEFLWRDLEETESIPGRMQITDQLARASAALEEVGRALADATSDVGLPLDGSVEDGRRLAKILELRDNRPALPADWLSSTDLAGRVEKVHGVRMIVSRTLESIKLAAVSSGPSWAELDVSAAPPVEDALYALERLSPRVDTDLGQSVLLTRKTAVAATAPMLTGSAEDLAMLSSAFGFDFENLTVRKTLALCRLAQLAGTQTPPEPGWLLPGGLALLEEAARVLEDLLGQFRAQHDRLAGVFTSDVLGLDLAGLQARFTTVHKGLHKLSIKYRADRLMVADVTVTKRADKAAISALGDALAWQQLDQQLSRAEATYSVILGARYYPDRNAADFGRLTEAIRVANEAVTLAAEDLDAEALASQLCGGNGQHSETVRSGERLERRVEGWLATIRGAFGSDADALLDLSILDLAEWANTACDNLGILNDCLSTAASRTGVDFTARRLVEALKDAERASRAEGELEQAADESVRLLGRLYTGLNTDWDLVERATQWVDDMRSAIGSATTLRAAQRLLSSVTGVDEVLTPLERWAKLKAPLLEYFTPTRAHELDADLDASVTGGLRLLADLAAQAGDIGEWEAFAAARTALAESGLEPVLSYCVEHKVAAESVATLVERALYTAWTEAVLKADAARLGPLRAADRDALVQEFAVLDKRRIGTAAAEIIQACVARRPTTTVGPSAIIRREAEKKTRHMPIRRLLAATGPVAQRLKPCFMMSPLAVSQFLPPDLKFDVVIFDEASQVQPSDAINCIYRGRQLVVAGDKNQLPPTNFFGRDSASTGDDSYDEDQLEEFSSVLELCKASGVIQSLPLQWHYRSAHESLITYSNYRFYDGKLLTFPGAIQESPDLGIELFKVNGVYRRGGGRDNPVEAAKVVERVLFHRRNHPGLSIGVVTFSDAQESAVEAELEVQVTHHPELAGLAEDDRLNGFFVKNLESVQGDERDIIIFSVGYGFDEAHKFTMQMGPLNRRGGWRRLNVAITRARRRVEVVTSVLPADFNADGASEGVRHLKGYLDYALRGIQALALDVEAGGDAEGPFEEEVIRVIRGWGYDVQPQVGVAGYRVDIGVRHPSRPGTFVLGVECDGAMYHSSKTARDRDRLRQGILEGLGWQLHRIWGPSWYRDRISQEARLRTAIEEAATGRPPHVTPTRPVEEAPDVLVEAVQADQRPSWLVPYVQARVERTSRPLQPSAPEARREIRRIIGIVTRIEQPVHIDRVMEAVGDAFGVERIGHRIRDNVLTCVTELAVTGITRDGDFLEYADHIVTTARTPASGNARPVRQVAPSEQRLALLNSVRDAASADRNELLVYVARLFGWGRMGNDIRNALDDSVDYLIEDGVFIESDGQLSTPHE